VAEVATKVEEKIKVDVEEEETGVEEVEARIEQVVQMQIEVESASSAYFQHSLI